MIAAAPTTHVLVIEDNAMNADVLRENLEEAGFRFALAVNGASGVAVANDTLPDIILMDVNLPILDGLSATRLLKKNSTTQGIPILALTARAMAGDREVCLAAGCDDYVSKPVDMEVLLAKIRHHLAKRPASFVEMIHRQRGELELDEASQDDPLNLKQGMAPHDYEAEFSALNGAVERLEAEVGLARLRVTELDESLAERELQIAALVQQRDLAIRERHAAIQERNTARAEVEANQANVHRLTAERDKLAADLRALEVTYKAALREATRKASMAPPPPTPSPSPSLSPSPSPAPSPSPSPTPTVSRPPISQPPPSSSSSSAAAPVRRPQTVPPAPRDADTGAGADRRSDEERAARRVRKLSAQLEVAQDQIKDLQRQLDAVPNDVRALQAQHEVLRKAFLQLHKSVVKSAEDALHQVAFGPTS